MKPAKALFTYILKYFFWFIVIVNAVLIFYKSLEYYPPNFTKGFLSDKEGIFKETLYPYFFYGHISISSLILIIGGFQFSNWLRVKYTRLHKTFGKVYIFLVLFVSAPSAFVMGIYATGSWLIKGGFAVVSVLWWWYTYMAYVKIKQQNIKAHKQFTQRSYIISLLAVFLRVYYYILVGIFQIESEYVYTFVVYASWLPNLLVFELYVLYNNKKKSTMQGFVN